MTSDLFSKFGWVTYMAIFDCEWHSLTENVSYTLCVLSCTKQLLTSSPIQMTSNIVSSNEEIVEKEKYRHARSMVGKFKKKIIYFTAMAFWTL